MRNYHDVYNAYRMFTSQATDPNDNIYGLLGIVSNDLDIVIDYRLSVKDVYIMAAEAVLRQSGDLTILSAIYSFSLAIRCSVGSHTGLEEHTIPT